MFDGKIIRVGFILLGIAFATSLAATNRFQGESQELRWRVADTSATRDSLSVGAQAIKTPEAYVLESDSALLRKMRPGETPLRTLERLKGNAKVARVLTGTGFVIAGPILFGIGAAIGTVESSAEHFAGAETENHAGPWMVAGILSTGTGIFMLCTKWEAERKWERVVRDRLKLGVHPSGKGALLAVSF